MRLRPVSLGFGLVTAWAVVEAAQAWTSTPAHGGGVFALLGLHATLTAIVGAIFTFSTARRSPARRRAREPVAFLACAVALLVVVPTGAARSHAPLSLLLAGDALTVLASLWIIVSALALGRCFGILPEARGLVTRGPYRLVRHPVYLGEVGAAAGLTVAAPSPLRLAMLVVFAGAQIVRMGLEEAALTDAFPEYADYAARTPRLVPRLAPRHRKLAAVRSLSSALLALFAGSVAVGCASKSDPPPIHLERTHIARHDARAVAQAVTIRAGDLPEFKAVAHRSSRLESLYGADRIDCLDRHASARSAERPWASATSESLSVGYGYHMLKALSQVWVMPSERAARLRVGALRGQRDCARTVMRRALGNSIRKVRGLVVEPLSISAPGGGLHVSYEAVASLHKHLILYMDTIAFVYDQDAIVLATFHASKPVPPAMDERLVGLLAKRARAHSGGRKPR